MVSSTHREQKWHSSALLEQAARKVLRGRYCPNTGRLWAKTQTNWRLPGVWQGVLQDFLAATAKRWAGPSWRTIPCKCDEQQSAETPCSLQSER